jgi:hypothetical protein
MNSSEPNRHVGTDLFPAPELRSRRETCTPWACQKTMLLTRAPTRARSLHQLHPRRHTPHASYQILGSHFSSPGVMTDTTLVPSLNRVRNTRFAFWNIPSFKLTTMNCEPLKRVLINRPIFCVCERSSAASTSSRMYMGAGLNWSSARISDSAMRDLFQSAPSTQYPGAKRNGVRRIKAKKREKRTSAPHSTPSNSVSTPPPNTP